MHATEKKPFTKKIFKKMRYPEIRLELAFCFCSGKYNLLWSISSEAVLLNLFLHIPLLLL